MNFNYLKLVNSVFLYFCIDKKQIKQKNTAMFTEYKVTKIYCLADDFCKLFDEHMISSSISDTRKSVSRILRVTFRGQNTTHCQI